MRLFSHSRRSGRRGGIATRFCDKCRLHEISAKIKKMSLLGSCNRSLEVVSKLNKFDKLKKKYQETIV